jgi:hypothetical protein
MKCDVPVTLPAFVTRFLHNAERYVPHTCSLLGAG